MEVTVLLGLTVVAALLAVLLRRYHPEQSVLIGLVVGVMLLVVVIDGLTPLLRSLRTLLDAHGDRAAYGEILLKGVGLCLLTQTAADVCRDAGETALAGRAELVGKVALLTLALPLFEQVLSQAVSLMKGTGSG